MDIQLHYVEAGSGQPLIFLHGNGEDGSYFADQIAYFKDNYHVIAVDTRGHGGSPRGVAPFTLDQFADDLASFMDEHGIESANLWGFSDGANIAMLFALKYPQRVQNLVLNSGNLYPEGLTQETRDEIDEELQTAIAENNVHQIELLKLMTDEPHIDTAELSKLDMPVLVIAGNDDVIEEEHTRLIANSIPNAQLSIVEGTHFASSEHPETFNSIVAEFLAQHTQ